MKIYLILMLLAPGLPNPGVVQKVYPDVMSCAVALERAIDDYMTKVAKDRDGYGVVGRCSTEPMEARKA